MKTGWKYVTVRKKQPEVYRKPLGGWRLRQSQILYARQGSLVFILRAIKTH